ncbi:MAG: YdcF family protein [Actinomycetota bacterium]
MFLIKIIWRFITFLLLVALVIPTWALARTWYVANNETIRKADAIVVMGAAQLDGRPGEVLSARLKETKRIYDNNFAPRIFTLGAGAPGDRFTEAGSGRNWLVSNGVPRSAITAVTKGRDTFTSIESFAKSAKKLKVNDIIIVTDPYHCLRSITMAEDQGFVATCSPTRVGIASLEKAGFRYLLREAGAYLAYITLGRRGIHISDHVA